MKKSIFTNEQRRIRVEYWEKRMFEIAIGAKKYESVEAANVALRYCDRMIDVVNSL